MAVGAEDSSVCVMNMANAFKQGGGWLEGTSAQEEQLMYRTTLAHTLALHYYPFPDVYPVPGEALHAGFRAEAAAAPADEVGVVFSPAVAIMRDGPPDYMTYDLTIRDPEVVSVVSVAALDLRKFLKEGTRAEVYPCDEHRQIMKDKIRLVLRACANEGQTRLVLGALGCGVFKNPPAEVAAIYREVFDEYEFRGWFKQVVFAILKDVNSPNVATFKAVLEGMELAVGREDDDANKAPLVDPVVGAAGRRIMID